VRLHLFGLSGLALAATGTPALAQQAAAAASDGIEEIVVTANKREERLSDVAAAVSVLGGVELERSAITQFTQFFDKVPGLAAVGGTAPGRSIVSLRGVSTGQSQTSAGVGFYVGEVPFGSTGALAIGGTLNADPNTFDVARVEVLKGPQGTLYGANTIGGLVKTVYNSAKVGETEGRIVLDGSTVRYGNEGYSANGMINLPLGKDVAVRATAGYRRDAGFIDNTTARNSKKDQNTADAYSGRINIRYAPDGPFSADLTAIYQQIDSNGLNEVDVNPSTLKPLVGDLKTAANQIQPLAKLKYQIYSAKLDYDFGSATLSSISSFGSYRTRQLSDESVSLPIGRILPYETRLGLDNYTQELRVASNGEGAIEWLGGFFYTRQNNDWTIDSTALNATTLAPTTLLIADFDGTARYTEVAGFANATVKLSDRLSLSGGVRLSENKQRFAYTRAGILFASGAPNSAGTSKDTVWTYSGAIEFRPVEQTLLYVRTSNGYRPGGPQVSSLPGLPTSFGPDTTKNYEAGVKYDSSDRSLTLDASVFYIDWKDIQLLRTVTAVVNGATLRRGLIENAGAASSRGFDFSARYRPTQALTLGLAGGYTDAQLDENAPGIGGKAGERIPYTPRFQLSGTVDYDIELGDDRTLTLGASARRVTARTTYFSGLPGAAPGTDPAGNVNARMPGYNILDLRVAYTAGSYEIAARVTNVTDKRAILSAISKASDLATGAYTSAQAAVAQPRTFGLSVSKSF